MSILVNTQNEREEKILLAFLDSLRYNYQTDIGDNIEHTNAAFLDHYNADIEQADNEVAKGEYVSHENVERLLKDRKKLSNGH
jgi:hypothetical protein